MKQLFRICVFSIFSLLLYLSPAYGNSTWFSFEMESLGQFITRLAENQYKAVSFPTDGGLIFSQTTYRYQTREGSLQVGWQQKSVLDLHYNLPAAQFAYHFIVKEPLPQEYSPIKWDLLSYQRKDVLLDLHFAPSKNWQFSFGGRLVTAQDLFRFKVMEATASQTPDGLTSYDLYGYATVWLQNQQAGIGSSYALSIQYTPVSPFTFFLLGDDLFGKIHWQGISIYHGVIDLDVIKPGEDGFDSFYAPIRGNEYTHDGSLTVSIPPDLRGGFTYTAPALTLTSWLRHHQVWEVGVKGTYDFGSLVPLTVGCLNRGGKWIYLAGVDTRYLQLQMAVNRFTDVTELTMGVKIHLY